MLRSVVYLVGAGALIDGMLHLVFPRRWNALWLASTRPLLPGATRQAEGFERRHPASMRAQGLFWAGIGLLLLWAAGPAETQEP